MKTFKQIIENIKEIKHIKHDSGVAFLLNIKAKTLATAKTRNSIPFQELIKFCNKELISIEWLIEGKGWAYTPDTASQAINWILNQLGPTVKRVLIVPYYDNLSVQLSVFGMANGFIIEKEKGSISISGRIIRSGGTTIAQNTYFDILSEIKSTGIRIDKISLADYEMEKLNKIDLSSLLSHPNIMKNIVDNEFNFYSKRDFAVTGSDASSEEDVFILYSTTEGPLDGKQVEWKTGLTQDELRSRCPGGPCEPLTLKEAEQIIKKRKPENPGPRKIAENEMAGQIKGESEDTANIGDVDLSEIIQLLKKHPENKNLVLKLLKGKQKVKEAMEGLSDK
jgi:hypothetical protein